MAEKRWHTREDSGIRLDAEGRFWHDDELVENPNVQRAFRAGLERDAEGRTLLRFGWDWCVIRVEDAAYQALGARVAGGRLWLRLDDEREVEVGPEALSLSAEGVLYARVPARAGELEARLSRAAQAQLAPLLEEQGEGFAIRLGGALHPLRAR